MTILSVMQDVSLAIGLARPTVVFTATSREWLELQSLANEAAIVVRDEYDWQSLQALSTSTGNGVAGSFSLPTDYGRMLTAGNLWSSRYRWGMEHVTDPDVWLELETTGFIPVTGQWIIFGDALNIRPAMGTGETAKFFYIRNTIVKDGSGGLKTAFTADTDTFRLDERLLKLCLIYLWKQQKGFDFTAELADYEQAVSKATGRDKGAKPTLSGNIGATRSKVWPGTVVG